MKLLQTDQSNDQPTQLTVNHPTNQPTNRPTAQSTDQWTDMWGHKESFTSNKKSFLQEARKGNIQKVDDTALREKVGVVMSDVL